jgi:hypothetical protein
MVRLPQDELAVEITTFFVARAFLCKNGCFSVETATVDCDKDAGNDLVCIRTAF